MLRFYLIFIKFELTAKINLQNNSIYFRFQTIQLSNFFALLNSDRPTEETQTIRTIYLYIYKRIMVILSTFEIFSFFILLSFNNIETAWFCIYFCNLILLLLYTFINIQNYILITSLRLIYIFFNYVINSDITTFFNALHVLLK